MAPLVTAALAALGLGGAYYLYTQSKKPQALDPNKLPLAPGGPPGLVTALDKGRVYAIQVMFDVSQFPGAKGQVPDKDGTARYIKTIFENAGFKMMADFQPRDGDADMKKLLAGQPSCWVSVGQWLKDSKVVDLPPEVNKIFPTAAFYIQPAAGPVS